ncbi:hypothetical protein MBLNU459_g5215t1 [Dothideomycetes sp. NU459]
MGNSKEISIQSINALSTPKSKKDGTSKDLDDMRRMGKIQQLRRNFGPVAIVGFASVLGCAWQYVLITMVFSLTNGGPAGAIWMYLVCCIGLLLSTISLAEMASMAPSAGGQYHWISELAPPSTQKILSYIIGWLCVLGWQVGLTSVSYGAALQIEGLAIFLDHSAGFAGWHLTFITIGISLIAVFCNTIFARNLHVLEFLMLLLHYAVWIIFIVVLLMMGPRSSNQAVWGDFEDNSGWGNMPLAVLVGIIGPVTSLTSADSVCHLAEELPDSATWMPRSMIFSAVVNFSISFGMLLALLYRSGDIADALDSPTGQPYIQILYNATGSRKATAVMIAYIILSLVFCAINMVTTSSRQLWSFARDGGLPFSAQFAKVSPRYHVPTVAISATLVFTVVISLIIIGSSTAFNIIVSLGACAILASYIISISCVLFLRIRGRRLLYSPFSLGKIKGIMINVSALAFLLLAFVMVFWPSAPNPTVESMNWSVLIFGAVVIFALVFYWVKKRHEYKGPVALVRSGELELNEFADSS